MKDQDAIRPECEHRFTKLEELLENHIPHVQQSLGRLEWWIRGIAVVTVAGVLTFIIDHFLR